MEAKHVLVTIPVEEGHMEKLQAAAPGWEFRFRGVGDLFPASARPAGTVAQPSLTQEDVAWADISLGNVPAAMLGQGASLEWLQTNSAGVEAYLKPGVLGEHTLLTNATGAYGLAISEHSALTNSDSGTLTALASTRGQPRRWEKVKPAYWR